MFTRKAFDFTNISCYFSIMLKYTLYLLIYLSIIIHTQSAYAAASKPHIITTIPILADIAKNLSGDEFEVTSLVKGNENEHTYRYTPRDILTAEKADLIIMMGFGLDNWASKIAQDKKETIIISKHITVESISNKADNEEKEDEHEKHENHGLSQVNPHIWLDPLLVKPVAEVIAGSMKKIRPEKSAFIDTKLQEYLKKIDDLNNKINSLLSGIPDKKIIAHHPAWPYFAKRYGITIIDTIVLNEGSEPSALKIRDLIKKIKDNKVKVIAGDNQSSMKYPNLLASETEAKTVVLYVMPGSGENAETYFDMMLYNAKTLAEALKN